MCSLGVVAFPQGQGLMPNPIYMTPSRYGKYMPHGSKEVPSKRDIIPELDVGRLLAYMYPLPEQKSTLSTLVSEDKYKDKLKGD